MENENDNEAIEVNSEVYTVAEFNEAEATIEAIKEQCDFIPDMTTKEGYEKSKRLSINIGKGLTKIKEVCKREKRALVAKSQGIQVEADSLIERIQTHQLPHKEAYRAHDQKAKEEQSKRDEVKQKLIRLPNIARSERWSSKKITEVIEELNGSNCKLSGLIGDIITDIITDTRDSVIKSLEAFRVEVLVVEKDAEDLAEFRRKKVMEDVPPSPMETPAEVVQRVEEEQVKFRGPDDPGPPISDNVKHYLNTSEACISLEKKCDMLIDVIKTMHRKHREEMIIETLQDEDELPTYENSVNKKLVDGIMNQ